MSRIFDALKKVQATPRPAEPAPPLATPLPAPFRHPAAAMAPRPTLPPPSVEPWTLPLDVPEDVLREMVALRVSLEAALPDRSPRVVAFHASVPGEGATTVARQFALALQRGTEFQVLYVDGNAHQPSWVAAGAPAGLRRDPGAARIAVLPLGERHAAEGRILPGALRDALDALSHGFDWIIVDGPPVLAAADAPALAAVADGVVIVIRAGRTKRPILARSADLLRKGGARVLGTVLNRRRLEIPSFIYRRL